ncbi:efflux RND transporter periplasmic adaptor subunit [Parahaliea mediterranea]|uniref:Efflux RND transporter periplasmic adaptor subunit n=1 Tax=Parahaliea mediterranea TaxID=651086 RepID=A0A939DGJ0_9GAMM|nr:efflux RND transporter periplasmic adaptor subunit [Parahaliea mediterranea]MBN7797653.1 efflux RND transporter periplasmic adaptor subunit [Parahaliea mediterranea]
MNIHRWFTTLAFCLLLVTVLSGFKYSQIQAAIALGEAYPEPSESVRAITLRERPSEHFTNTIGEVVAPEQLVLRNELAGRITALNMMAGQEVRKGQVLVQQDVAEHRAQLAAAEAGARLAGMQLERLQRLLENNTASQDKVDQARAEHEIARARIDELQAIIDRKTLRAPFDARVGLHDLEPGEYLAANSPLVELVGIRDRLWVDFNLPLAQGRVAMGDTVSVALPPPAGERLQARVIARSPALSARSRNLGYRAEIDAHPALAPNAVVNVRVSLGTAPVIRVPVSAVLRDQVGSYVFRLDPDGDGDGYRARRQSVTLGRESHRRVDIIEGLKPGMLIATDGAFKLHQDMLAFVRQRTEPAGRYADLTGEGDNNE